MSFDRIISLNQLLIVCLVKNAAVVLDNVDGNLERNFEVIVDRHCKMDLDQNNQYGRLPMLDDAKLNSLQFLYCLLNFHNLINQQMDFDIDPKYKLKFNRHLFLFFQ